MHERDILDVYTNPKDILRPIAAALEAARYIALDPNGKDLAADLIAWAHETAAHAATAHRSSVEREGKHA
ncbi:hypothetical protein [Salmonella enterica]|uniref:hypothetical protein n=1 Tax=Salmonella enterica TaxID=28901 RepID=UPI0010BB4E14|nr:hypothetical protein [Salmonella enterica]VGM88839.1 hypothetical protein UPM517_1153 [Salmonella enterica subsp. enterica serovar Stanley]